MSDLFRNLFIFEMANNHQGSVDHGLKIIREMAKVARRHGVRAGLKFQYRDLDTFIHPDFKDRDDVKHIPRFRSTALNEGQFRILVEAVREEGLLTIVTPFDEASVDRCIDHGIDIIKVASCSASDWPLLERIATTDRPVIASTGGNRLQDIDSLVSFFTHKEIRFALMHCVGVYPSGNEILHLNFIGKMSSRYPYVPIGWSGHEAPDNTDPVKIAVAKGATLLERHVGVPTEAIRLNAYSMSPDETSQWIAAAMTARRICGPDNTKQVTQEELDSLLSLKRGVFAARAVEEGKTIVRDDVFFAMPCSDDQLTSSEFGRSRATFIASRSYERNEPIRERSEGDSISLIREFVHDVKGMLYEAQIHPGRDVQIELSHHDGIDHFRCTGAVIVNVVNRTYCKKLIVILPGQAHPAHAHKIKEETFQLLWGDLTVSIDGTTSVMKPGDQALVEPGQMHAFRSRCGAIFEEISTTHRRDDSYYEDENINKMDPLQRKTILEDW